MTLVATLNALSAVSALAAAAFWGLVAVQRTPEKIVLKNYGNVVASPELYALIQSLQAQARWNRLGAVCAATAAIFQIASIAVSSMHPCAC